ncbi:hypothetical protein A2716_03775 [candidate division WWE3 bacterium RIFCSPHIGHO2_01_FULL_40_23]|uniref:Uncharacterized protein n=1 Tax=candidate division WWE3 bacterium RIFCSPLOWO2_01_FULL_41_18 TaxID=1802625 RepID=A0A1F4VDH0_UNCKA|nr:MAG: hypothetical protein A2716_03775 [candidate division WWE3 bacterium RIFCSPHIGHO2_01_FULL_40_23]OGC54998.1 MAG: hypothetical protein A3A78_03385 [candidate division WWE3 bacterium RIFCSPLOWO2_01_FULL_41_18]
MEEKKHISHLIFLFVGLSVSFLFFFLFRFNLRYQFFSVLAGVSYYVLWAFVHHYLEDRLTFQIILEYVLIGGIVTLLFAMVLGI